MAINDDDTNGRRRTGSSGIGAEGKDSSIGGGGEDGSGGTAEEKARGVRHSRGTKAASGNSNECRSSHLRNLPNQFEHDSAKGNIIFFDFLKLVYLRPECAFREENPQILGRHENDRTWVSVLLSGGVEGDGAKANPPERACASWCSTSVYLSSHRDEYNR